MNAIISFANAIFKPLIDMGAPTIMLVVLTIIALCFRVKFSKALEGGMKLAIALTAIGDIMNLLTTSFAPAMDQFVKNTGMHKDIMDMGWGYYYLGFSIYLVLLVSFNYLECFNVNLQEN